LREMLDRFSELTQMKSKYSDEFRRTALRFRETFWNSRSRNAKHHGNPPPHSFMGCVPIEFTRT
jgi:hypothetical protein